MATIKIYKVGFLLSAAFFLLSLVITFLAFLLLFFLMVAGLFGVVVGDNTQTFLVFLIAFFSYGTCFSVGVKNMFYKGDKAYKKKYLEEVAKEDPNSLINLMHDLKTFSEEYEGCSFKIMPGHSDFGRLEICPNKKITELPTGLKCDWFIIGGPYYLICLEGKFSEQDQDF